MGVELIRKRDGRVERFDPKKIANAIMKALKVVRGTEDYELAWKIATSVVNQVEDEFDGRIPTVENVQDVVERNLIEFGLADVAKAYILYRAERAKVRDVKYFLGVKDDLKLSTNAVKVLQKRYLMRDKKGRMLETPSQMFRRVAKVIANVDRKIYGLPDADEFEEKAYRSMRSLEFLPNSPTLMNTGTPLGQLSACFVIPVEDSIEGIYDALKAQAIIHKTGGGCIAEGSRIYTTNRGLQKVEDLYSPFRSKEEVVRENCWVVDVRGGGIKTFYYDEKRGEFRLGDVTHLWRYELNGEDTYTVLMLNGVRIRTSAWHPFLVLKDGRIVERRADELREGDLLIVPGPSILKKWPFKGYNSFNGLKLDGKLAELLGRAIAGGDISDRRISKLRLKGRIPEEITKSPPSVIRAFMSGIIESANSIEDGKVRIELKDGELAKDIASLASLMGLRVKCRIGDKHELTIERPLFETQDVKELEAGPILARVEKVGRDGRGGTFYDLTVDGGNNYLAGEFGLAVVHNTGFDFSNLRPKGDYVSTTGGSASGPVTFMRIFDESTNVIKQGGRRRGANMGVLRVDHPDIIDFITAKSKESYLDNFNISVAVTDKFMKAVENDEKYPLINPRNGEVVKELRARDVFDLIAFMAWKVGDPGLLFIDEINRHNPILGTRIEATNPCGEQPLLPYESCNLGSVNLAKFVVDKDLDWDRLRDIVRFAVRFLDNVIDANKYPLKRVEEVTKSNRKIGLGVMGFAEALAKLEVPYDSEEGLRWAERIISFIEEEGHKDSQELGELKGSFSNFDRSVWKRERYKVMRNATVTTIAPTGTISIIADCSSGIEPFFSIAYVRNVLEGARLIEVNKVFEEYAKKEDFYSSRLIMEIAKTGSVQGLKEVPDRLKRMFRNALEIESEWHVRMQAAFQKYVDNAVSKTVNLRHDAIPDDVKKVFKLAYKLKCKGVTVYRYGSKKNQVLTIGGIDSLGLENFVAVDSEYSGGCFGAYCTY